MQLALLPAESSSTAEVSDREDEIVIAIPLSTSGIPDDSIVVLSGVMVSLEAPSGWRWKSGWKSSGSSLFPDQKNTQITFTLKKKDFERVQRDSVNARISLALTMYHDQNPREFVVPQGEFAMPDWGFCSAEASFLRQIRCRAPLRTPSVLITSDLSATTCDPREGESRAATRQIARDWHQHSDSGPAELGVSPVKSFDLYLWNQSSRARQTLSGLCPGTPLIISNPEPVQHARTNLEFSGLRLADYRLGQVRSGNSGFGFSIR